jgi:hypothetical protein
MDPQLSKVEALTEPGCVQVTLDLPSSEQRAVVARFRDGEIDLPAQAVTGWSPDSASFQATVAALVAVHAARELARPQGRRLHEVAGGWDVGLGNIVLDPAGQPACVTHGALEADPDSIYRCPECGAAAGYR